MIDGRMEEAQKPRIQKLKAPRKVTSEASLTLKCKAKAKPNPVYSWYHNGQPLKSGRGLRIKSNKRGSRLKISKAKMQSAGVYTCTAANALGETSKNVTVKVTKAGSIHKPCEKQTFCFNGGSCRYLPDLQQTFCQCPKRWAGRRCELLDLLSVGLDPDSFNSAASLEYERVLIVVGIIVAFLVFVVICIASYFLAKRRRKRWETRKRMRKLERERNVPLLDQPDGIHQPRGFPLEKETQTDPDTHPPDLPPKREHVSRANYNAHQSAPSNPSNADTTFHMDHHFPLITYPTAPHPPTTSPPLTANGRGKGGGGRPGSGREVERRGSRSRLKAVSVDDSCKDRPPSWKGEESLAGRGEEPHHHHHPVRRGGGGGGGGQGRGWCPEVIEMDDLGPRRSNSPTPSPDLSDSPGDPVEGLPGFLSSFSSPGDRADPPIRMNTPPKDNAHAQLKTPEEQSLPPPSATADYDIPKPSPQPGRQVPGTAVLSAPGDGGEGGVLTLNGLLPESDSETEEEEEGKGLPLLHISEEDLNAKLSKADSLDSRFLPSAPAYSSEDAKSPPSGSCPTPSYNAGNPPPPTHQPPKMGGCEAVILDGHIQDSFCDDDCGGFLPHAFKGLAGDPPRREAAYCFDPAMDSDPNDIDQFMHVSPKASPGGYSSTEVQQDYERRLRNVLVDSEAIPI
ncbi:hypothetical protein ACOMHN_001360 [Nucella lapillus]